MTEFAVRPEELQDTIAKTLADKVKHISLKHGEVTVVVAGADYMEAARTLRDAAGCQFEQLIDLCGVGYSEYGEGGGLSPAVHQPEPGCTLDGVRGQ